MVPLIPVLLWLLIVVLFGLQLKNVVLSFVNKNSLSEVIRDLDSQVLRIIVQVGYLLRVVLVRANGRLVFFYVEDHDDFVLFHPASYFASVNYLSIFFLIGNKLDVFDCTEVVCVKFEHSLDMSGFFVLAKIDDIDSILAIAHQVSVVEIIFEVLCR